MENSENPKKILEIRNTVRDEECLWQVYCSLDKTIERISELEDMLIETSQIKM